MKIIEKREVPGLARLYLASFPGRGRRAEFVDTLEPGVPKERKWVLMISTQIGCPIGCRMCDAGAMGFQGNLRASEMLAQARRIFRDNPGLDPATHPKLKIHFARMGEPSLNPAVLEALEAMAGEIPGPGLLPSLSTTAPASPAAARFLESLASLKTRLFPQGRFQLQFSLHGAAEEARRRVVPVPTWPLERIAEYGDRFVRPGDRKITLNFAPAPDEGLEPDALARVFRPEKFLIKVTPVNPTQEARRSGRAHVWLRRAPARLLRDASRLRSFGFTVILSPSLPAELEAATSCGQLWSRHMADRARSARRRRLEKDCYIDARRLAEKSPAWRDLARGRGDAARLDGARSALLVVDMQEFFLDPESPAYRPQARAILGNVASLAEAFRRRGRPVILVRHAHRDPAKDGGLMASWWRKVCLDRSPWSRPAPRLARAATAVVRKDRYSAFRSGELPALLRRRGVRDLAVAGVMTNLCVESTVRDAFDEGYRTWVPADATAAHTEELHTAALKSLAFGFSSVVTTSELISGLRGKGRRP